ncbi:MAG TPA: TetR/AcrR family transcriptional regulator [Steroidobacteraceae bacterium]|nr:TetR/AcrR family transcriptional regulator [Steroidobacteraceae bacterium]
MGTRDTQTRIVDAALELFNEHGTAAVSTNRIAEHCGISKGNLHYHFRNKEEIIRFLWQRAVDEMDAGWYRDHLASTLDHMAAMFVRQLQLILDYRFFYREMADLLRRDKLLRRRFAHNRERRLAEIERFFRALGERGLMSLPEDPQRLRSIVDITWIISENWLNYVEYHDRELTVEAVEAGYDQILEVLRPYLSGDPQRVTSESYSIIERLTAQPLASG